MKKYVALLLVLIFALSFMSAVAFAEGEVKSPEGIDHAPVDKPVISPQTGIGGICTSSARWRSPFALLMQLCSRRYLPELGYKSINENAPNLILGLFSCPAYTRTEVKICLKTSENFPDISRGCLRYCVCRQHHIHMAV